ncbi:hypothetical protein BDW22DRAFT_1336945, partial [Trametopsis cervina]
MKRVRTSQPASTPRRILLEEVDLEIALQERISAVIESRMTWALLLHQTLENSRSNGESDVHRADAALDALEAIEQPCNFLYTQNLRQAPVPTRPHTPAILTSAPPSAVPDTVPPESAYGTRHRGSKRGQLATPRKLLFLRNHTTQPPQTVKLACPDCGKTSFSSLQGLLNHCRLSHKREFGSHDECVQCCAVLVESEEEQAWVAANGTEVAGISIPGLRRLFEMAVGGDRGLVPILPPTRVKVEEVELQSVEISSQAPDTLTTENAAHVTRTLGHHIDSPALAPFLGKESRRRDIHVYEDDAVVDVIAVDGTSSRSPWKMHYTHRSKARASLDEIVEPPSEPPAVEAVNPSSEIETPGVSQPVVLPPGLGSRFHIVGRVNMQDFSVWIPPERRSKLHPEHTHKWRLVVASPSYSLHLSTFMTKLTVTCMSDPAPSTLSQPITVSEPPFVITSTTDRPFLACLTLEWVTEGGLNPPTTVEHWVELDPMHYITPTLGDEQVIDVELDRHTQLLPEKASTNLPSWDDEDQPALHTAVDEEAEEHPNEPDYSIKLRAILPRFPMTAKDSKGRPSPQVPYTLVSSPAQLHSLVYGRRKAIEWGRAHALRSAYAQELANSPNASDNPPVPLSTGDVLHWLEDEDLLTRKAKPSSLPGVRKQKLRPAVKMTEPPSEMYCRFCGLHFHLHPNIA